MLTIEKESKKKKQEIRTKEYALFLLRRKYGEISYVAKLVGVSEKMIYLYIENYWIYRTPPLFQRKKGAYDKFLSLIGAAKESFESKIRHLSKKKGLDLDEVLEIFRESIKR